MVETKENSLLVTPRQGSGRSSRLTKGSIRLSEYRRPFHLAPQDSTKLVHTAKLYNHLNNVFNSTALHPSSLMEQLSEPARRRSHLREGTVKGRLARAPGGAEQLNLFRLPDQELFRNKPFSRWSVLSVTLNFLE